MSIRFLLFCLLCLFSCSPSSEQAPPRTNLVVRYTPTPIQIDAQADQAWQQVQARPLSRDLSPEVEVEEYLSPLFQICWDEQALYLWVEVEEDMVDTTESSADGFVVYLDPDNNKDSVFQAGDQEFFFAISQVSRLKHPFQWAYELATEGYAFEMAISWNLLGVAPTPGTQLGFELIVVDGDPGKATPILRAWHLVSSDSSVLKPRLWGTIELGEK